MGRSVALLTFLAAPVLHGCTSQICTLIGCADSLEVRFSGATAKPGLYQIEVVADGLPQACQLALPHSCGTQAMCSGGRGPLNWRLMLSECGPGIERRIEGFVFYNDPPASLDFVVRRDDVIVGGGTAKPVYKESRPNGPDCEPLCRQAPAIETTIAP